MRRFTVLSCCVPEQQSQRGKKSFVTTILHIDDVLLHAYSAVTVPLATMYVL